MLTTLPKCRNQWSSCALCVNQHTYGHVLQVHGGPNDDASPVIHVQLSDPPADIWQGKALLQHVVDDAFDEGVFFTVHRLSDLDKADTKTPASICVAVTATHTRADMQKAADALQKASSRCLAAK